MTTTTVKPCPFCGEEPEIRDAARDVLGVEAAGCKDRLCPGYLLSNMDKWNSRPLEDALRRRVEEAERSLEANTPFIRESHRKMARELLGEPVRHPTDEHGGSAPFVRYSPAFDQVVFLLGQCENLTKQLEAALAARRELLEAAWKLGSSERARNSGAYTKGKVHGSWEVRMAADLATLDASPEEEL